MPDARPRTFIEEARRRQIVDCTIELVSDRGFAATSLAGIAGRAGISKAAVLYHFTSKDAVLDASLTEVLDGLVGAVGAAVADAEGPEPMLLAYLSGVVAHMRDHPARARFLTEVLVRDHGERRELVPGSTASVTRWQAVAGILELGQQSGAFRGFDSRTLAVVIGGALDAIVAEWLGDPTFDLDAAAAELETVVLLAVRAPIRPEPAEPGEVEHAGGPV